MTRTGQIVIFTLDEQRYGIPLEVVERVVRIVEITPLPAGPDYIHGVINIQGEIIPVLDLRKRFGLPERPVELSDQLLILRCANRGIALMADAVREVRECPERTLTKAAEILPDLPFLTGVVRLHDSLILVQDPEALFSNDETATTDALIGREQP